MYQAFLLGGKTGDVRFLPGKQTKGKVLLYPKEADFHLRQGKALLLQAAGFSGSVTSMGRDACLLKHTQRERAPFFIIIFLYGHAVVL